MAKKCFPPATLSFLNELAQNNNRAWFNENKSRYEADVLDPALAFIEAMVQPLAKMAPNFTAIPKRVGGSLMRVYRDTRFSPNKQPYKTNIGMQFRHKIGKDVHAPGYYVHIDPDEVFLGVGVWHPEKNTLAGIRERIAEKPDEWKKIMRGRRFNRYFSLAGESLKRPPRGFDPEDAFIDDIKRKDFIAVRNLDHALLTTPEFHREVVASFKSADPFMRFLCASININL